MSRPLRLEFPGAVWHLYNRGVNRQDIFFDDRDRNLFLNILERTIQRFGWLVHAWVQMTNHYHLLVETPQANLSAGMHDLDGDFAQAINRRHGRVGHLFQSRFRDALVEKESHLLELIRYVVLNPVRAGMVDSAGDWAWSSYHATAGLAPPAGWLEVKWTLAQFDPWDTLEAHRLYREFVAEGAGLTRNPWEDLRCGLYLGSIAFGERLRALVGARCSEPEYSKARRHPDRPTLDELQRALCAVCLVTPQQLQQSRREPARALLACLARDHAGTPLRELTGILGVKYAGVSKLVMAGRRVLETPWGREHQAEILTTLRTARHGAERE